MGAFVGDFTSPFFRRRKGRIGQDKVVEHTPAPALAGAEFRFAASNGIIIMCGPNAATTVQISKDSGASWAGLGVVAPDFIGNLATGGHPAAAKPFNIFVAQGASPQNNNAIDTVGAHPGIGGGSIRFNRDGNFNVEVYTVANAPQESIAYTEDGTYFCSVGAKLAGLAECAGGRVGVAVEFFDFACTAANGMATVIPLTLDPNTPFEASFIGCEASAAGDAFQPHKIWRIGAGSWGHKGINVPAIVGNPSREAIQRGAVIIFTDAANPVIMRSVDYGETWTEITMTGGAVGPTKDLFRYGRFAYILMRDTPRIMRSRNNGTTWEQSPVQLISATAIPDVACMHNGDRMIFCHDGAANRIYKFKHANDI